MRNLLRIGVLAVLSGAGAVAFAQQPMFRASTEIVPLYVTVTDDDGRLVPSLLREDFEVYDNGELQELTFFENEIQPITVVVMLDTSASMTANLTLLNAAAEQFFLRMLPDDRGNVGAFNDKVELALSDFTSSRDELVAALDHLDFGNPTRLYDAIGLSLDTLVGIEGRRVTIVLTDGEDTSSRLDQGDVLDRARAEEVMIYAIGLESTMINPYGGQSRTRPDRGLRELAEETGGGYFELDTTDDLGPTFTRVAQELHSQYVLGFSPTELDGRVHELEVRVKTSGMEARARRSYVATPEALSGATPQ